MKAIIVLPLRCSRNTPPQGAFIRSEKHDAHIFQGKEFALEEFNRVVDKALKIFADRSAPPTVRMVADGPSVPEKPEEGLPTGAEGADEAKLSEMADGPEGKQSPTTRPKKRRAQLKPGRRELVPA